MKKRYVEQPDRKQYKRKYILRKVEDKEAKELVKDATSKLTRSEEDPEVPLQQVWRVD